MILGLALVLSAAVNVIYLKWRFNFKGNVSHVTLPEKLLEDNEQLLEDNEKRSQAVIAMGQTLNRYLTGQRESQETTSEQFDQLTDSFLVLRQAITQRDQEIKRLQEGYDVSILLRAVNRFVDVDIAMAEEIADGGTEGKLDLSRELLQDALEECGVEEFCPSVGEPIRTAEGIEEGFQIEPAPTLDQVSTIARIVRPGYRIQSEIVKPARVIVYGSVEVPKDE